jgi:hypothetical protein
MASSYRSRPPVSPILRGHVPSADQGAAGNIPLGNKVVQEIAERADGVPLFVEELTVGIAFTGEAS